MAVKLTSKERQIIDVVLGCIRHYQLNVIVRIAGGWVRDKLLGRESDDIDMALDCMTGQEFAGYLHSYYAMLQQAKLDAEDDATVETRAMPKEGSDEAAQMAKPMDQGSMGRVHVIATNPEKSKHLETATLSLLGESIDFVNLRSERYDHPDGRIPSHVSFGSAEEDAYRRDLTINALFYNIHTDAVEDYTKHGLDDLAKGYIRTPLPPKETFLDDPLRILRVVRFAARFGYDLDPAIFTAAQDPACQDAFIHKVSRERVLTELEKMLCGPRPELGCKLFMQLDLFTAMFILPVLEPELVDNESLSNESKVAFKDSEDHALLRMLQGSGKDAAYKGWFYRPAEHDTLIKTNTEGNMSSMIIGPEDGVIGDAMLLEHQAWHVQMPDIVSSTSLAPWDSASCKSNAYSSPLHTILLPSKEIDVDSDGTIFYRPPIHHRHPDAPPKQAVDWLGPMSTPYLEALHWMMRYYGHGAYVPVEETKRIRKAIKREPNADAPSSPTASIDPTATNSVAQALMTTFQIYITTIFMPFKDWFHVPPQKSNVEAKKKSKKKKGGSKDVKEGRCTVGEELVVKELLKESLKMSNKDLQAVCIALSHVGYIRYLMHPQETPRKHPHHQAIKAAGSALQGRNVEACSRATLGFLVRQLGATWRCQLWLSLIYELGSLAEPFTYSHDHIATPSSKQQALIDRYQGFEKRIDALRLGQAYAEKPWLNGHQLKDSLGLNGREIGIYLKHALLYQFNFPSAHDTTTDEKEAKLVKHLDDLRTKT